jgi:hypothetical protein
MRRRSRHYPGFGPWSVVLLPAAGFLAWCAAGGFDLRLALLRLIAALAGWSGLVTFVTEWLPAFHFACLAPVPGPITLCTMLLALHVSRRPRRWWTGWVLAAALAPFPLAWWYVLGKAARASVYLPGDAMPDVAAWAVGLAWLSAVAWWLTRRRRVVLWVAGVTAAAEVVERLLTAPATFGTIAEWMPESLRGAWPTAGPFLVPVLWNAALLVLLLRWAARERRESPTGHACAGCGYDLRGLEAGACPECGATAPPPGPGRPRP